MSIYEWRLFLSGVVMGAFTLPVYISVACYLDARKVWRQHDRNTEETR